MTVDSFALLSTLLFYQSEKMLITRFCREHDVSVAYVGVLGQRAMPVGHAFSHAGVAQCA